jgi:hypothetical protein
MNILFHPEETYTAVRKIEVDKPEAIVLGSLPFFGARGKIISDY